MPSYGNRELLVALLVWQMDFLTFLILSVQHTQILSYLLKALILMYSMNDVRFFHVPFTYLLKKKKFISKILPIGVPRLVIFYDWIIASFLYPLI